MKLVTARRALPIGLLILGLGLAGCGGSGDSESSSGDSTAAVDDSVDQDASVPVLDAALCTSLLPVTESLHAAAKATEAVEIVEADGCNFSFGDWVFASISLDASELDLGDADNPGTEIAANGWDKGVVFPDYEGRDQYEFFSETTHGLLCTVFAMPSDVTKATPTEGDVKGFCDGVKAAIEAA